VIGSSDTIVELEGEGVDSVLVNFDGFNLSAAQRVEWIILDQVPGVFSATGNNQANTLVGNSLNNTLNGAAGADSMAGGLGDDFYFVDDLGDVVFELAGQGTDSVLANVDNYTLAGNVEYMTLGLGIVRGTLGPTSATLMGNASNNSLFGGAGDDTIDGGAGADWIEGGLGNDSLVGGDGNDTILGGGGNDTIDGGAGNDSIVAGAGDNFVLAGGGNDTVLGGDGNDTLDGGDGNDSLVGGDGDDSLTGGAGLDTLLGGAGDDTLDGGSGNDILDGGPGADRMVGGLGNDTFFVDNLGDVVIEFEGEGIDWVVSAVNNHTLAANVEHLSLLGGVANGFGNSLDNSIFGNAENNSLFGGAGNDTLIGDAGNDTLNGGPGDDSLIGGLGDDYYIVDSLNDRIFEAVGEGMDSVLLNVDAYNLVNTVQVEWMIFGAGLDVVSATGNSLANTILGNAGNNTINGGPGADSMAGGDGDDFYFADNIDDRVYELPGEGIDTVRAAVNNYTLDDNVDVLILVNTAGIITGTGNTIDNTLVGNALGNSLFGIGGNNSLDGGGGNDTLVGGDGNDTLNGGTGNDWMIGGAGDDLYFVDAGGDVVVELEGGGTDSVIATVNHTLADHVEYLELQGTAVRGIGNSLDNTLVGNSLGNSLNGGVGADTMIGGLGNDTYFVDNLGDVVVEELNEGTDIVISSVNNFVLPNHVEGLILTNTDGVFNGSGNSQANTITGNNLDNSLFGGAGDDTLVGGAGNDTLNGGTGNDSLVGGTGDDFYIVDSLSDVVVEIAGQGTDSVLANVENLTLADHVEVLILGTGIVAGYGNSLDNSVIGNASNNSLFGGDGNDTLFGLAGSDTLDGVSGNNSLVGGTGDDFYIVRSVGDSILELSGGGIDSVLAHLPSYTLPAFVEHLILGDGGISGFGNTLNNSLYGNNGDNSLDGVAGVNTMIGGEGNDTYFVRSLSDVVVEDNEQGHDWIVVEFSGYTLQNHVEGLLLLGAATYGAGNAGPNTLVGNSVLANSLSGGAGDDTLVGGSGNDTLDGGPGADSMVGGDGDDYYIVDDAGDEIVDSSGIDSVLLNLSGGYTLPDGIEHLILGTGDMGAGNALSNSLIGNSLNNTLSAGTGGINTLIGGLGDDYYILNSLDDLIIEFPDGGIDTVYVNFPGFDLSMAPNVENLVLGPLAGGSLLLGDSGNNLLIGNDLDNTLDGVGGINTLVGGDGNDFYEIRHLDDLVIENPDEGIDSVRSHVSYYALTPNVNVLILAPGAVTGVGNDLDNTLIGNSTFNSLFGGAGNDWIDASAGGNNTLNGGTGADTMIGGPGNDYFVVDDPGDSVVGGGGNDGIISLIEDYTLPLAFNILVLGQGVQRGTGNANNNSLTGNSLANTLAAGAAGADTLIGGIGHDYYIINSADDLVVERALEGTDTVEFSGFATYTLPANVERLVLGAGAVDGYGNSLNNTLSGNAGNNSLFGGAGRDSLFGGDGNDTLWGTDASRRNEIDTLTGGGGADLFVLGDASVVFYNDGLASQVGNTDYALITDFNPAEGDRLQLRGAAASYYLGAHTVTGLTAHQGLFLELGAVDELIAIIQPGPGAPELTNSNVIENAVFV
jgi:Ca2+-binding RTX toxin-like protein